MKKKLWKKAAVALGFGLVVAGIGVGGNALYANADETDSSEPSTVQNAVLETPEMRKGFLRITSDTPSGTEPNDNEWGYVLTMKLTQSDLSEFSEFWWNLDAKSGAYANSVSTYTECFVGFEGNDGTNYVWTTPKWSDATTDVVYYSPTFLGNKTGVLTQHFNVQLASHGDAWYSIAASDVCKHDNADPHSKIESSAYSNLPCAKIWLNAKIYNADLSIGALYGVKADGSYTLLFDPSQATATFDNVNGYKTETNGGSPLNWSIAKIEATNLMPLHDGIGVNNYFDVPVANVLPEDISAYNGISYYIDNIQSTLPTDLQLKIREKDNGEQWYSDNQKATLFYENSETATGDYVVLEKGNEIPAGKKGTVVIPFSSFYRMWDPNINNKFDLNSIGANLTLVYHPQAETYANGYSVGNFTLVTDAKAKFKEYRLYQKVDGSYPEITVSGNTVTYEDNDNIKAIDRVETDGASFDTLTKPESGIPNENLYEFGRATVPTKYTPVTDGGEVNVRIVPLTYYARKEYTISFTNGAVEGETFQSITQKWGSPLTMPETARIGYDFVWKNGETEYTVPTEMPAEDITLTAVWTAKTDTAYTVKHFKQLADGTYSQTPDETENKTGTTDTLTAETAKDYDHYTAQTITQQNIAGNGSAVVEIKYVRNEYTISFTNGAAEGETFQSITQRWGSALNLPDTARVGYDFVWKNGETEYDAPTEMPAENITLTAVWTAKTDTAYTVKHFKQLADGTYSQTPDETENKTGTTDTLTAETAKGYDHYTAQTISQQNIAGNGSAVVEIRYARNSYTVTFLNGSSVFATKNGLWGSEVELPEDPTGAVAGMVFGGWYLGTENDGAIVYGDEYNRIIPTSDLSVFAKYGYPYTVKHFLQNLTGDGYDEQTADSESKVGDAGDRKSVV